MGRWPLPGMSGGPWSLPRKPYTGTWCGYLQAPGLSGISSSQFRAESPARAQEGAMDGEERPLPKCLSRLWHLPRREGGCHIFPTGSPGKYVTQVKEYQNNTMWVANASKLKDCIDQKLTDKERTMLSTFWIKYARVLCVSGAILARSPREATHLIAK